MLIILFIIMRCRAKISRLPPAERWFQNLRQYSSRERTKTSILRLANAATTASSSETNTVIINTRWSIKKEVRSIQIWTFYTRSSVPDPWHFGVYLDPGIHARDLWIRIRIRIRIRRIRKRIRILLFWSLSFKTPTKDFKKKIFCLLLFEVHLHHFSKIKSPKEVTKQ